MPMGNITMTGLVGSYPNGGFPSQAFYGVQGFPVSSPASSAGGSAGGSAPGLNLFSSQSTITVVATILILLVGGYALWHFTA